MSQQYTADGFLEDCDELMQRCVKEGTLTFESFTHIWRDMNFSSLYVGRSSGCEIAELSEEVIHIAKHYMLNITDNYEQSVAGLFLVYSLLNLQPFSGFANVRITPEDITGIQHLESVARRERRYEVLYILGSVLIKGPVQYQAALRERGMEPALRKYLDGYYSKDRLGTKPKGVFYGQYEEIGLIQELNSISNRYSDAKAELSVDGLDRNLCYAKADLAKEFEKSLKKIISGNNDSLTEDEDSMFSDDATKAQNLKIKAMKNKVDPMRHLVGVHDKSVSSKEEEKSAKKSKKKANNKRTVRSLDMDYDSSECEANMTGTDVDSDNDAKVAIQIDKLPGVIRTEDGGKVYEIEIIDHQKSLGIIDDIMNEEEIKKICNKIVSPKKFGCQKFGGNTHRGKLYIRE